MADLIVHDPFSGEQIEKLAFQSKAEIQGTLERARATLRKWRATSAFERSQLLNKVASEISAQRQEFIDLIRREAGKPVAFAGIEVDRAVGVMKWAAAEAERYSGELLRLDTASNGRFGFGIHCRFPRGVVLGITPFN